MSAIAEALVAALAEVTAVAKGQTADAGSYTYRYADLDALVSLTRPALAEHGIIALQSVHDHDKGLAVTTTLLHTSGETLDFGPLPFPAGRDAQATGSAITYHRRYALLASLGLATEDDDGATATRSARRPQRDQRPPGQSVANVKRSLVADLEGKTADPTTAAKAVWESAGITPHTVTLDGEDREWVSPEDIAELERHTDAWLHEQETAA